MGLKTTTLSEAPVQYPLVNASNGMLQDGWLQLMSELFDNVITLANASGTIENEQYTITQVGLNTYYIKTEEITESGSIEITDVDVKDGYLNIYTITSGIAVLDTTLIKVVDNILTIDIGASDSVIISGILRGNA